MRAALYHTCNLFLLIPFCVILFTPIINGNESGNVGFFVSLVVVGIAAFLSLWINRRFFSFSKQDGICLLFCLVTLSVTVFRAGEMTPKAFVLLFVFFFYIYTRIFFSQIPYIFPVLICFFLLNGLLEAVWGIFQLYKVLPSNHDLFRTTGSFFNPGPYGGYLAVILPVAFFYALRDYRVWELTGNRKRYLYYYCRWILAALTCGAILLVLPATLSRGAWIGAVLGCGLVAGGLYRKKISSFFQLNIRYKTLLLTLTSLVVVVSLARIYTIKKDSADGRVLMWKMALFTILDNPVGTGLGYFAGSYGDHQIAYLSSGRATEQELFVAGSPEYGFNEYLQIGVEGGVVALLLFLVITGMALRKGWQTRRYDLLGAFCSLLVFAFTSYPLNLLSFVLLLVVLLVGMQSAAGQTVRKEQQNRFLLQSLSLLGVVGLTAFFIYSRIPFYEAEKEWKEYRTLYAKKEYEVIIEKYQPLFPLLRHNEAFLFEYARSLSKTGQYEESNRLLTEGLKISCDPMFYNIMGTNHQSLGRYEEAGNCFNRSAALAPSRLYPWYLLAKLYDETGNSGEALRVIAYAQGKRVKTEASLAIREMRNELKEIEKKYNTIEQ